MLFSPTKEIVEKIRKKLPGINMSAYKQSEALVACRFTITYRDIQNLFAETPAGLPKNKKFREEFFNLLKQHLTEVKPIE